jgi:hypothetical protein
MTLVESRLSAALVDHEMIFTPYNAQDLNRLAAPGFEDTVHDQPIAAG